MDLWLLRLVTTKQGRKKWKNCRLSIETPVDCRFDRTALAESRLLDTLKCKLSFMEWNFSQLNFSHSINVHIIGAFDLHFLEFTFIYWFYSRKTILVESIFWNPAGLFAFMSFHIYFKLFWYCVLLNMRGFFCPYLFWDTVKWYLNW